MAIHCYRHDDDFAIWTDCEEESDHDGRCLGLGKTFEEAKADALGEAQRDLAELEALTPDVVLDYEGDAGDHLTVEARRG